MIAGLLLLLLFQGIGELLSHWFGWPIPGPVVGMLLLFASLQWLPALWPDKLVRGAEQVSGALIGNLNLLFLPAGVGLFFMPAHINAQWPALLAAILLGTFISLLLCSWLLARLAVNASQATPKARD